MGGTGAAPKPNSRTRHVPIRGRLKTAPGVGWQHGDVPKPPDGLLKASRDAWATWMAAWFAAHWLPSDLPALRHLVMLYDQVERGEFVRSTELRLSMDTYGISPKGQQDRRWVKPEAAEAGSEAKKAPALPRLRVIGE